MLRNTRRPQPASGSQPRLMSSFKDEKHIFGNKFLQETGTAKNVSDDATFLFAVNPRRLAQIMVTVPVATMVVAVVSCVWCPHFSSAISWVVS